MIAMKKWAAVVALVVAGAGCASRTDVQELRDEITKLKEEQAILRRAVGGSTAKTAPQAKPLPASFDLTGAQYRGSTSSPVVLVEFSDYECPFCIRHFTQVAPQLDAQYIQSKKIRYTFRDFPIDQLHPESIRAHVAAHCATEQGKFWDLHPKLFSQAGSHQPAQLLARAKEAGLNEATFSSCVAADKYSASIRQSTAFAISLGAEGTPFFLVGIMDGPNSMKPVGKLPGAMPLSQFQQAIDAALAQAK